MELKHEGNPHLMADGHPTGLPAFARWIPRFIFLLLVVGGVQGVFAQEEEAPELAVQAPLAAHSLALDAVAVDGKLVVVGQRGHILISSDGGASWQQAEVPTRANLTGVYFHDQNLGWAVGHDSVILRTVDGGTSWERMNWAPDDEAPFFDVWFSDADNGIAIGAYGSCMVTADSGETWDYESISDDYDFHLHQIKRSDDGRLYIAAEAGMVYASDDGGSTWVELPSPYEGSFFGVLPLQGDEVLIFGLRGHLFRSEDAGESWVAVETGTVAMLTDGVRLPDGKIAITGLGGALLVSEDGGRSFELQEQPGRRGIQAAVLASNDALLLVGEFGIKILPLDELGGNGKVAP